MAGVSDHRELCAEMCALRGEPPCWKLPELTSDAGPDCLEPCDQCEAVMAMIATAERRGMERAAEIAEAYEHGNPFPTMQGAIARAIRADMEK